ncbi:MAG: hypothetical protein HOW71_44845 [Nonomuraea sp.]|nr:hypothetical protein [Nonomuraea sp.]NUQ95862.1 hypothetical protein [Streptomyces sp.]NUS15492.1 hypothetical protein [Streptomyces sp.]NUS24049.1 hypothetical protein [Streptomyces sp.]
MDIGKAIVQLQNDVSALQRSSRLSHASIENTAVQVYDGAGSLRGILGVQADGTTAVNIVNGAPPPQPSAPVVTSELGGVTVVWDGTTADGSTLPLDWQRVEVHASTTSGFTPDASTLRSTIETPQGGTQVVMTDDPVYVRLLARNTSGIASPPSDQAGPFGPIPVVAADVLDGTITTLKLADDAVTQAKVAVDAIGSDQLEAGAVLEEKLAANAVTQAKLADQAVSTLKLADDAVTAAKVAVNAIDSTSIQDGAISTPKLAALSVQAGNIAADAVAAGKVAADAITARELAANSVTAAEISAGSVTAAAIAAGAVTTDKLTVTGGANLLSDPSFEGAYTAALVTGVAFWSVDATKGNGSTASLKVDATAGTPTNRDLTLFSMSILPGDQLYLAVDYQASTDYVGTPRIYARWEDSTGTFLSSGAVQASPPTVGATWQRITGTVTAPANTAKVKLNVASTSGTTGSLWFDNAAVRPVAAATQIQDGAITTTKIAALTIQAGNIAADAIAAGKIAADAVTAREIAALAVTAAEIAANTITAGKLAVGAVDATALAADAITGKTITGGTITGTTITGALIQTAATGERITLDEAGANKVLVYSSTSGSTAIGELSSQGLLVKGTNGAVLWLNPNATYPQLKLYNAGNTNSALVQVNEDSTGQANLVTASGRFTSNGFTDMNWRTWLGQDGYVVERVRASDTTVVIGAIMTLTPTAAQLGITNTQDSTQNVQLQLQTGIGTLDLARFQVNPPASANSGLYVNGATGHTGNLLRAGVNGTDKFAVSASGDLTVAGIGQRVTKRRTTDATKTSTTTPGTDGFLTFTVDANATYILDGFLKYSGPGDFLMGWTFPTGTLGEWHGLGNGTTVASEGASNAFQNDVVTSFGYTVRTETTDIASTRTYGGIGSTTFGVQVRGIVRVGSTAGTFALQWAQGTSNATGTVLYTDSHIRLEKVA